FGEALLCPLDRAWRREHRPVGVAPFDVDGETHQARELLTRRQQRREKHEVFHPRVVVATSILRSQPVFEERAALTGDVQRQRRLALYQEVRSFGKGQFYIVLSAGWGGHRGL